MACVWFVYGFCTCLYDFRMCYVFGMISTCVILFVYGLRQVVVLFVCVLFDVHNL